MKMISFKYKISSCTHKFSLALQAVSGNNYVWRSPYYPWIQGLQKLSLHSQCRNYSHFEFRLGNFGGKEQSISFHEVLLHLLGHGKEINFPSVHW